MDIAVIGRIIVQELTREPKLYREIIAPALAKSPIGSYEIISGYAECAGVKMSKTQISWLIQHDDRENKKAAKDAEREKEMAKQDRKMRYRLDCWKNQGVRVYSLNDFPEWVIAKIGITRLGAQKELNKAVMEIMAKNPRCFPSYAEDTPEQYAVITEKSYFTNYGYKYLIATAQSRKWVTSDEYDQWRVDSGLYEQNKEETK